LTVYLLNTLTVVSCKYLNLKNLVSHDTDIYSVSAIYAPLAPAVQEEFHVGIYVSRLPLTFFLFGFSVGPLVLSPLGEDYGRRWTFSICFFLFYIFQIPCALAENIATLITCRFIGGILASPILNACGAIPDLWPTSAPQAGWALNFWAVSAEIVVIVPWIGALIERRFDDWRMVFWLSMAVGGALAVVFLVFVPETRHGVILAAKAASLREKTGNNDFYATHERAIHDRHWSKVIKETCIRPIGTLAWCTLLISFI
jgi:MFS transporter, DHA1 family, multidrug resistance protein